jgi:hypothetical protein
MLEGWGADTLNLDRGPSGHGVNSESQEASGVYPAHLNAFSRI